MRTNIVLDDKLIQEAFRYTAVTTKRELINLALREFVNFYNRRDIRELKGKAKIHNDCNYKALRNEQNN